MTVGLDPVGHTLLRKLHKLSDNTQLHTTLKTNHAHDTTFHTIDQAYTHINTKIAKGENINLPTLQNELPHIPHHILKELTKCTLPVTGYHPHINQPQGTYTPITTANLNNNHTSQLKFITWNAGCINSSLPGILDLTRKLHKDPHIILIQETKIHNIHR